MTQSTLSENNKRIARNTLYLYLRMGATMAVQLYTSRVVLDALGIDDFGIYNIVGAVIVMFVFVSGPLGQATQRFFNFELGRPDGGNINKVFNISLVAYLALTLLLVLVIETAGGWYVANRLNIPAGRTGDAMWVFHLSVISLATGMMRTPFESLIISHERMDYYAWVSIADVALKLANALSLTWYAGNLLRFYAVNHLIIALVIATCVLTFCRRTFRHIRITRTWDRRIFRSMLSFSGWTLLSSVTTMGATHGVNLLLNLFFGVAVNSAMGIATQVSTAINQFVTNFQTAFNPQIVKYYSAGDTDLMQTLAYRAAKVSYLLLLMIVCPLLFNMDFVLGTWLKDVPPYTAPLCIGMIVWTLLESLMAPLWTSVTATGKVKIYHITMSIIISAVFLLSWASLAAGMSPVSVVVIKCAVDIVLIAVRLLFTRHLLGFSVTGYIHKVIGPTALITGLMAALMCTLSVLELDGWSRLLTFCAADLAFILPVSFFTVLSAGERSIAATIIRQKLQLT